MINFTLNTTSMYDEKLYFPTDPLKPILLYCTENRHYVDDDNADDVDDADDAEEDKEVLSGSINCR